jgi:hypothetical protein
MHEKWRQTKNTVETARGVTLKIMTHGTKTAMTRVNVYLGRSTSPAREPKLNGSVAVALTQRKKKKEKRKKMKEIGAVK